MTGPARQAPHPLEGQVVGLAADVASLCDELGEPQAARLIREEARTAREGAAVVVAVGEKKRGKSSLLNTLLGRPGLLPVDADVATNVHITVGYADPEWARVIDDASPEGRDIPLADIGAYAALDPETGKPRREGVRRVDIGLNVPLLADGLMLIDTPGVGGLVAGHRVKTMAALTRADALLFVLSGETELTASECQFLKEATERIATVLFVLAKKDVYQDWPEVIRASQELVGVHAARFTGAPWFAVSSRSMDDAAQEEQDGDAEFAAQLRADSGFPLLIDDLRTHVAGRAREIRLANLLYLTTQPLTRMIAETEQHGRSLGGDSAVPAEITTRRAELGKLTGTEAEWRRMLGRRFSALDADLRHDLTRRINDQNEIMTRQIAQGGLDILSAVQRDLQDGLEGICLEMSNQLATAMVGVMRELSGTFDVQGVDLMGDMTYPDRLRNVRPLDPVALPAPGGLLGALERGLPGLRNLWFFVRIGIEGPLAALTAGLLEWRRRGREKAQQARGNAQRYLQQMTAEARAELPPALAAVVRDTRERLEDHVAAQIALRRDRLAAALAEHERLHKQSEAERASKKAANEAVLSRLRAAETSTQSLLAILDPDTSSH